MRDCVRILPAIVFWIVILYGCNKKGTAPSQPVTPPADTTTNTVTSSDVAFYLTKGDGSVLFNRQAVSLNFGSQGPGLTITVDSTKTYQTIDGFGYCLTGGSAYLINHLAATDRDALLKELFLADSTHIGVSYLRISIGASDLSANVFSYDDAGSPSSPDTSLAYFASTPRRYRGAGAVHDSRRAINSDSDTLSCSSRACASIVMESPSRTNAMLPPA